MVVWDKWSAECAERDDMVVVAGFDVNTVKMSDYLFTQIPWVCSQADVL